MATIVWQGKAPAVQQVSQATITGYDAGTTYKITIGGQVVSCVGTGGTVGSTAAALLALLQASTHPYFTAVVWSNPSGGIIRGTAAVAGAPFTFTATVSGGTGSFGAVSDTTANSGPNDWTTAANWVGGSIPVGASNAELGDGSVICWGLDQSAVTLGYLRSGTTRVGLNSQVFTTDAAGTTPSAIAAPEYRQAYLAVSATNHYIGNSASSPGGASGPSRFLLNIGSVASQTIFINGTASTSLETDRPAVRLLSSSATSDLYVNYSPGGCGLAMDAPGETSAIRYVYVSDPTTASRVYTGNGVSGIGKWDQIGGTNLIQSSNTVTVAYVRGGILTTQGSFAVTGFYQYGGIIVSNSSGTVGAVYAYGGTFDLTQNQQARIVSQYTLMPGSTAVLKIDGTAITLSALQVPVNRITLTAS